MTSVSSGGRSAAMIPLQTLEELEMREQLKQADGVYAKVVKFTPYDTNW